MPVAGVVHRWVEKLEEVEIPDGHVVCLTCDGRGKRSRYDEGWRSLSHSRELAAKRTCYGCNGLGWVPE